MLSIAIPTYKRADRLAETLNAFFPQLVPHNIQVCISYTDDTDSTMQVINDFRSRHPFVTVVSDPDATNIDRKIVSAVALAKTRYVWLFGDDDLPEPGAIDRVLKLLSEKNWGLLVLNGSSYDSEFSFRVEERRIRINNDRIYAPGEHESLLSDTASYATFLGGLVFDKAIWDSINPADFLGTDYVHVAVLYRAIIGRYARLVAEPQLRIRLGNTTWASRYFEVELIHWPHTIWELPSSMYSAASKRSVCQRRPTESFSRLMATRAYGYYDVDQYHRFLSVDPEIPAWKKIILRAPLVFPQLWVKKAFAFFRRVQTLWGNPNLELSMYRLKEKG